MADSIELASKVDAVTQLRGSIETALADVAKSGGAVELLEKWLIKTKAVELNQEHVTQVGALLTKAKREFKRLEKSRRSIVDVPNALVNAVNATFKETTTRITKVNRALEGRVAAFELKAQREQAEAWRDAAAAEEAGQDTVMREALARSNVAAEARKPSNISTRKVWTARVENPAEVPRDWCMPDIQALNRCAKGIAGDAKPPTIPGVVFEQKTITSTRTA